MKEKIKILFLSPYPEDKAPSQRLKYEQYFECFRNEGFEIETKSFVTNKFWDIIYKKGLFIKKSYYTIAAYIKRFYQLFFLHKYDIVYVHLWVTPIGLPIFEVFTRLFSKKLIYDIDDMIFLGHSSAANRFMQNIKGKGKMIYLMKKADHVITCTPKLTEFVNQFNTRTTDISSTVDTNSRYNPQNNYENDHKIIIGWSGSHSTSKYLYLLEKVLKRLAKNFEFTLMVMGDENFRINGVEVIAIQWLEAIEMETLKKFDIGLYPLPDEEWVYGKSGLKAIQYMALGIPTIATAIGANYRIIEDEKNGFLIPVGNDNLWYDRLSELIVNAKLRKSVGEAGRKTIEKLYSIDANKDLYIKAFHSCVNY